MSAVYFSSLFRALTDESTVYLELSIHDPPFLHLSCHTAIFPHHSTSLSFSSIVLRQPFHPLLLPPVGMTHAHTCTHTHTHTHTPACTHNCVRVCLVMVFWQVYNSWRMASYQHTYPVPILEASQLFSATDFNIQLLSLFLVLYLSVSRLSLPISVSAAISSSLYQRAAAKAFLLLTMLIRHTLCLSVNMAEKQCKFSNSSRHSIWCSAAPYRDPALFFQPQSRHCAVHSDGIM